MIERMGVTVGFVLASAGCIAEAPVVVDVQAEALTIREILEGAAPSFCWSQTGPRGIGTFPTACENSEASGALCYPACEPGYVGVGPVCWESCALGYRDEGLTCRSGFQILFKQSHGRGFGAPKTCAAGLEMDAGLCYAPCEGEARGIGPVCWQACPDAFPVACGAGCAISIDACALTVADQVVAPAQATINIAAALGASQVKDAIEVVDLILPPDAKQALRNSIKDALRQAEPSLSEETLDQLADVLTDTAEDGELDLTDLDPTGLVAVFEAFYFPVCSESLVPAVP